MSPSKIQESFDCPYLKKINNQNTKVMKSLFQKKNKKEDFTYKQR